MPLDPGCARALEAIMRGDPSASGHLAACPICREQLEQIGAAILSPHADEIPCAELRAQLPILLSGSSPSAPADTAALTRARAHLERCPECQTEHQAAQSALLELSQPDAPLPPTTPTFDTRFLRPSPLPLSRLTRFSPLPTTLTILALALIITTCAILLRPDQVAPTPSTANPPTPQASPTTLPLALAGTPISRATVPTLLLIATPTATSLPSPTPLPSPLPPIPTQPASPTSSPSVTPVLPPPPSDDDDDDDAPPQPTPSPTTTMRVICDLDRFGPVGGILQSDCRGFAIGQSSDLFRFEVTEPGRWTFTLCARTELDTLLALYPAAGFDPTTPCSNLIAYNDDHCNRQSRLELDLPIGQYLLLLTEKSGDLSGDYTIQVRSSAQAAPQSCPFSASPAPPTETPTTPPPTTQAAPPTSSPTPSLTPTPGTPSP